MMRIKVRFLLCVICFGLLCAQVAQSTVVQNLTSAAKNDVISKNICRSLVEADAAFRSGRYEQAVAAAKQVLSYSTDTSDRIKAHRLIITSVRSLQGYNAAILRTEQIYAYIRKTRPSQAVELSSVRAILSDIKDRRVQYERTISEQKKIITARSGSDMAAQAALKIALCKQALGTRKDALLAYAEVVHDYPLTRSGWKAAQELAWLNQSDANRQRKTDMDMESTLKGVMKKSGRDEAAKQAWAMACGTKDFSPTYSDVLRLEAIVSDLDEESSANNESKKDHDKSAEQTKQIADTGPVQAQDKSKTASRNLSGRGHTSIVYQPTVSSGLPPTITWPEIGVGTGAPALQKAAASTKTGASKSASSKSSIGNNVPGDDGSDTTIPSPANPMPKVPAPGPAKHALDRWICDSQYRELGDDDQAIRDLMKEHLAEAAEILSSRLYETDNGIGERRRAIGIALTAAIWASDKLDHSELAKSICDIYLMPNLNSARTERGDHLSQETVMLAVISVWQKAGAVDKVINLYKQWIGTDSFSNTADANRIRLAEVLAKEERYEEAIGYLQQINDNGDCSGAKAMIAQLEELLKQQCAENNGTSKGASR